MKNKYLKNAICFSIGSIFGVIISKLYFEQKYKKIADNEIESVKSAFSDFKNGTDIKKAVILHESDENFDEYDQLAEKYRSDKEEKEVESVDGPYIISDEEFGIIDNYEYLSLTYYSDGILTDDYDEVINEPESIIGNINLENCFEEDDVIFIRDDEKRRYYEISYDQRLYKQIKRPEFPEY